MNYLHVMCPDLKPVSQFTTAIRRYCCLLNTAFNFTHHPVIAEQMDVVRVSGNNTMIFLHTWYRSICNISTTYSITPWHKFKIYGSRVTPGKMTFKESFTVLLQSCEIWQLNAARKQDQIVWLTFEGTFCEMLYRGALICLGLMVSGPEVLAASNRFIHAVNLCANMVPLASKPCTENFYINDFLFWRCVPSFNK